MKKIILSLFITVLFNQMSFSQFKGNILTEKEYYSVKINDITMLDIIRTRGDYSKIKSMFGNDLKFKTFDSPTSGIEFSNSKMLIRFEEDDKILTYLKLHYPTTITIQGKKVKIGDNVSALGLVKINTDNGKYSIYYADEETYSANFTIKVNPVTRKIKDICYILF